MVFEYMDHGDLAELLRSNDAASGRNKTIRLKQVRQMHAHAAVL